MTAGARDIARTVAIIVLTILTILLAIYLLIRLGTIVQILIVALFLAVALYPAVEFLLRRGMRRTPASLIVVVVMVLCLLVIAALGFPSLLEQLRAIISVLRQPGGLSGELEKIARPLGLSGLVETFRTQIDALPAQLGSALGSFTTVTANAVSVLSASGTVLVFAFFLLNDGAGLIAGLVSLFPKREQARVQRILDGSNRAISGYITGNVTISVIAGVSCYIGMSVLGIPYALALSIGLAIFDLIPIVGATLGAIGPLLAAYSVSPVKALILLVYIIIYQNVENHVLNPLVYGRSVHLPGGVVMLAVMIGGELMGIIGALIAIPIAEIIRILIEELKDTKARAETRTATAQSASKA